MPDRAERLGQVRRAVDVDVDGASLCGCERLAGRVGARPSADAVERALRQQRRLWAVDHVDLHGIAELPQLADGLAGRVVRDGGGRCRAGESKTAGSQHAGSRRTDCELLHDETPLFPLTLDGWWCWCCGRVIRLNQNPVSTKRSRQRWHPNEFADTG